MSGSIRCYIIVQFYCVFASAAAVVVVAVAVGFKLLRNHKIYLLRFHVAHANHDLDTQPLL